MSESARLPDPYQSEWNPREYLRQYYSTSHVPDDSTAVLQFLIEQLPGRSQRFNRSLEFGCGPALYTTIATVPYVQDLELADYLPENLQELRHWLNGEREAHDWDVYFRGVLELERGVAPTESMIAARKEEVRRKVTALRRADIRQEHPLGAPRTFDLVTSFYCLECVTSERGDWKECMERLSGLVKPGGTLIMAALRGCNGYKVLGRMFPTTCLDEEDFNRVLPRLGFDERTMVVRAVPITAWVEVGFDSICLIAAEKLGTDATTLRH